MHNNEKKVNQVLSQLSQNGVSIVEIYDPLNRESTRQFFTGSFRPATDHVRFHTLSHAIDITELLDPASQYMNSNNVVRAITTAIDHKADSATFTRDYSEHFVWVWHR